jgi:membrane protease YdiL (CAAX protease family)
VSSKVTLKPAKTKDKQVAKDLGSPARVIVNTLLIFLLSQVLAAFLAEIILGITHPHTSINLNDSIPGQFGYILVAEFLAAYAVIFLVRRRGLSLSSIGLGRRPNGNDVLKAVIGFVAFYVVLIIASLIVNALSPQLQDQKQDLGFTNIHTSTENLLAFLSLVIIPPLGEETLVRGYLYSGLRKVWRFWPALLVTSLLFGVAHLEFGSGGPLVIAAALDTFLLSVVLVFLRENTGALYAGIAVHMLNNLIAFSNLHH